MPRAPSWGPSPEEKPPKDVVVRFAGLGNLLGNQMVEPQKSPFFAVSYGMIHVENGLNLRSLELPSARAYAAYLRIARPEK
jgi:hypothetical protein